VEYVHAQEWDGAFIWNKGDVWGTELFVVHLGCSSEVGNESNGSPQV
jgi:hypothetical protein